MLRFVFDCETNGLLHELDTVHSLVLRDIDSGDVTSCSDHDGYESIANGLYMLSKADLLVGHNIINFDFRSLKKVYKNFKLFTKAKAFISSNGKPKASCLAIILAKSCSKL